MHNLGHLLIIGEIFELLKEDVRSQILDVKRDLQLKFIALSPSEDFAYYAEKFPSCFFYIGCTPKGVDKPFFNHHPKFDIDEDALLVAAKAVGQVVCGYYRLD
ncbi:hypothetical protein D3C77_548660 [compost metagenome]